LIAAIRSGHDGHVTFAVGAICALYRALVHAAFHAASQSSRNTLSVNGFGLELMGWTTPVGPALFQTWHVGQAHAATKLISESARTSN
jgi:hypothetical protein